MDKILQNEKLRIDDYKAIVVNNCVRALDENMENRINGEYDATVGFRQGAFEDEEKFIFIVYNPANNKMVELKVNDNDWFDLERAKKQTAPGGEWEDEDILYVLQLNLREVLWPMVNKQTDYDL